MMINIYNKTSIISLTSRYTTLNLIIINLLAVLSFFPMKILPMAVLIFEQVKLPRFLFARSIRMNYLSERSSEDSRSRLKLVSRPNSAVFCRSRPVQAYLSGTFTSDICSRLHEPNRSAPATSFVSSNWGLSPGEVGPVHSGVGDRKCRRRPFPGPGGSGGGPAMRARLTRSGTDCAVTEGGRTIRSALHNA